MHEAPAAGAASAAAELLAFYREPVRHRIRYLHGEQDMPDGGVVFRLALGRFPQGWLRDMPAAQREEVRTAAGAFVRLVCLRDQASHYQLLCVAPDAGREAIKENYHLLIALVHPDRQDAAADAWPTGCSQRANLAYETLANPDRRAAYDKDLVKVVDHMVLDASPSGAELPRGRTRVRLGAGAVTKRFLVLAGTVAALFMVQAWWVSETSPHHALLERSFHASSNWMRGVLPDVPRFIARGGAPGPRPGRAARAVEGTAAPRRARVVDPGRRVAAAARRGGERSRRGGRTARARAIDARGDRARAAHRAGNLARERSARGARSTRPGDPDRARPAQRAGEGRGPVARGNRGRHRAAGRLLRRGRRRAARRPHRWRCARLLARLPRARRLRGFLRRDARAAPAHGAPDWQVDGTTAQARGEATVVAEFQDGRARLERRVPVEVDIVRRDGRARVTRLVLYPLAD
jgi:curved DNA-binding protein CbpA